MKSLTTTTKNFKELSKLSKGISLSETISLLVITTDKKELEKEMNRTKDHKIFKEFWGEGFKGYRIQDNSYKKLKSIKKTKSYSMLLTILLKIYGKDKFEEMRKIKVLGRSNER